jgi:hypothetical protein
MRALLLGVVLVLAAGCTGGGGGGKPNGPTALVPWSAATPTQLAV